MESIQGRTGKNWTRPKERPVETASDTLERQLQMIEEMSNQEYDAYLASLPHEKLLILKQNLARIVVTAFMVVPPLLHFIQKIS